MVSGLQNGLRVLISVSKHPIVDYSANVALDVALQDYTKLVFLRVLTKHESARSLDCLLYQDVLRLV